MKYFLAVLLLIVIPSFASADTHVELINLSPDNPDPGMPFRVYVKAVLPDQCWSQGPVGDLTFSVLDSFTGDPCPGGLFYYLVVFELEGLPEGHHSVTVTELHDGTRDPGSWEHLLEFTVGNPPVGIEDRSWSSVKAIFR